MASGFVERKIFTQIQPEYQGLSLSAGGSTNLPRSDFKLNTQPYASPTGCVPFGFSALWGGHNKVGIRMMSLYDAEESMLCVKNVGSSATGYVDPALIAIFIKSEYVIDLDGDA